jgi:molybdenum cofactor cytidylyltransferase
MPYSARSKGARVFEAVILAAGRSRRAGTFKPAHLYRGEPLLRYAVNGLAPWCRRLIVVAGHREAEVAALVAGCDHVLVVTNPAPDEGMFSSVRCGVRVLHPGCRGFFVLPADCPLTGATVPGLLLAAFTSEGGQRAIVPEHAGRGGHPVLLPAAALALVFAAPATATLREVIAGIGATRLPVAEAAVLMDLDTRADLDALVRTEE